MESSIVNDPDAYVFHINDAKYATHVFWQPGVGMFANMNDSDISDSEIYVMDSFNADVTTTDFKHDLTYAIWPILEDVTLTQDMIDIYINSTETEIYVDLRDKGCPSTLPPIF